jgi:hypothetical protein
MLKTIKLLFIFLILLFSLLLGSLLVGVKIEHFSFLNINVTKLYIKLDKKLIVQIESLHIPLIKTKEKSSTDSFKQYLHYLPMLLNRFDRIDIEELTVADNKFSLTINDEIVYIDNPVMNIAAKPILKKEGVILDLYSIYLKDYDLLFDGMFYHIYSANAFEFEGNAYYKHIELDLKAASSNETIDFEIKGKNQFESLAFVKDFVRLHPTIEAWMYDNVTGLIELNHLKGKLNRQTFMPKISSFEGEAYVHDAAITFNPKVKPVHTPKVTVNFKDDNLYFNLDNPFYNQTNISGSKVVIYSLSQGAQPSNIVISLKTNSALNNDILEVLKGYNIVLPLIQKSGTTQSQLDIKVVFKGNKLSTQGVFKVQDAHFDLSGLPFYAHDATVVLDNHLVQIQKAKTTIDSFLKSTLDLQIDTKHANAKGDVVIESLQIDTKEMDVISINDVNTPIMLDYGTKGSVLLQFPELFTKLDITQEATYITLNDLQTIYPYSPLLNRLEMQEGILKLKMMSKNEIDVDAWLHNLTFPLYTKEGDMLRSMELQGKIHDDVLNFYTPDERIKFSSKQGKHKLFLNQLDIKKPNNINSKEGLLNSLDLHIVGKDSNILLTQKQKILAQSYDLVLKNDEIALDVQHQQSNFSFLQQKQRINIFGLQLSDVFMNEFLGVENLFTNGEFTLNATGTKKSLKGSVDIQNSKLKDLAVLNNLITLINTTPGLINPLLAIPAFVGMASKEGFNLNGYRIMKGTLDFTYNLNSELFFVERLDTVGNMVDFKATGVLDLNEKSINADAMVIFLKDYSNIIDYIPVVNYLFLGEERNISTLVKITGNIDDPKIETNLSKEAASAPLNFIKRIFNLPSQGLELLQPKK